MEMNYGNFLCLLLLSTGMYGLSTAKHIQCKVECSRATRIQRFGFSIAKQPVSIDVGECRTNLPNEPGCETNTHNTCIKRCVPRSHEYQDHSNRDGPFRVAVIRSCYPTFHHCLDTCVIKPRVLYLFPDSKYQTRVDVKKCSGQCEASNSSCVPTRIRTTSVDGPNGPVTLSVIEKCECRFSVCYRQDYYQSHWNYSQCDNSTNRLKRTEMYFNVGRCVGGCEGVQLPGRCYPSPQSCLLYIPSGPAKCVPDTFTLEHYYNEKMERVSIPLIKECSCGTG